MGNNEKKENFIKIKMYQVIIVVLIGVVGLSSYIHKKKDTSQSNNMNNISETQNNINVGRTTINDIKDYIEKYIGITNYQISNDITEKIGDDGYTDYYWNIKYKDIEFSVIKNYYWGEWLTSYLYDNFDHKVMDYHYKKYNNSNKITYRKDYVYNENTLICEVANEQKEIDEKKLKECYNNIIEFINTIDFKQYPMHNISVEITNSNGHVKWLSIYHDNHIKTFEEFKKGN